MTAIEHPKKHLQKMKTRKMKWLPFLLLAAFVLVIPACKDKNEVTNDSSENSVIVGSWRHDFSVGFQIRTFKKDGTGIVQEYDSEYGGIEYTESFTYYYDKTAEQYKIVEQDGKYTYTSTVMYVNQTEMVIVNPDGDAETYYKVN